MPRLIPVPALFLTALFSLLAATNPDKQEYAEHLVWTFQTTTCQQVQQPPAMHIACSTISLLPTDQAAKLIASYSQQQNFVFFSLYTTNFLGLQHRSIGIGKMFVPQPELHSQQSLLAVR